MVISEDGKRVINTVKQNKGYAVRLWDNYIIVSSQSGPTCLCVYDKATLSLIATINFDSNVSDTCDAFAFSGMNSIVGMYVANDVLYVCDQGANGGVDQVLIAPLTDVGKPIVEAYVSAIAERLKTPETTPAVTTEAPKPESTKAPEETKAPEVTTKANDATKAPEETKAPETTKAAETKKGCGSSVAVAAVAVCAIFGSALVIKKRK